MPKKSTKKSAKPIKPAKKVAIKGAQKRVLKKIKVPARTKAAGDSIWIKAMATHGNFRGIAIDGTALVKEAVGLHGQSGVIAKGLAEALMAGLLIGSYCKEGERINVNIQGSGYFSQGLVDAYPDGKVRGYVIERNSNQISGEQFELFGPWGEGVLSILRTRDTEGRKQPYIGTVPLVTGHLAKDLTFYWHQSEQIPSAVGIQVEMEKEKIKSVHAFMVQALPGASPEEVRRVEQYVGTVKQDRDPKKVLAHIFQSTPYQILEERKLALSCGCSWERAERAIALVGAREIESMLNDEGFAIVKCDFCTKEYKLERDRLSKLISGV